MAIPAEKQTAPQPRQVGAALLQLLKRLLLAVAAFVGLIIVVYGAYKLRNLYDFHYGFDQQRWMVVGKAPNVSRTGGGQNNPRRHMVDDVMAHYLRPGMTRAQVVAVLGPADSDGVQLSLPDGVTIPDSVEGVNIDKMDAWFKTQAQPDTIMHYYVGWDIMDPISLRIRFNGSGRVNQLRVVSH